MNDSTTVQLRVGEVSSVKISPSILTLRNAGAREATRPSASSSATAWMGRDLDQGCPACSGFLALDHVASWTACTNCGWRP